MRFCVKVVCAPHKLGLISYIKMEKHKILKIRFDNRKLVMGQEDLRLTGTAANLTRLCLERYAMNPPLKEGGSLGKRQSFKIKVLMMIIIYNAVTVKINLTETVA